MSLPVPLPRRRLGWRPQLAWPLTALLAAEGSTRLLYAEAPVLEQRLCELHGWLALVCLLAVLAARPLRVTPYRRALGLSAFGFGLLHLAYVLGAVLHFDPLGLLFLSPGALFGWGLGLLVVLGMMPLAATSTDAAMRRMGPRWKRLHRITPALTVLAALHTVWTGVHGGLSWPSAGLSLLLALILLQRKKVL